MADGVLVIESGVSLHYRVTGDGPETLVLLNGVGDDLGAWAPQMPDLLAAGLRVVALDNRGVGGSGRPPGPYRSAEMAEDLHAVVRSLGLRNFHLAGVSMGGVIAQEYGLAHPGELRSLVLANTYAAPDPFSRAVFQSWADVAEAAGMAAMVRLQAPWIFSPGFYAANPDRVAALADEAATTQQPVAAFSAQTAALLEHDARDRLASLGVPTLVLAAREDIIIRPELSWDLWRVLPHAVRRVVPGGHAAFWEDPGAWNRAVIEFVRAHHAPTS